MAEEQKGTRETSHSSDEFFSADEFLMDWAEAENDPFFTEPLPSGMDENSHDEGGKG